MVHDIRRSGVSIYHGLSNELPAGIRKTRVRTIVTIHDLIFEKHPEFYHLTEVWGYKKKFKAACRNADLILATSEHTKNDIVELYDIPPGKVAVSYQSCEPVFWQQPAMEKTALMEKYQLPEQYFLYLGSIIARKDLLTVCRALKKISKTCPVPLVVIGEGKDYKRKVKKWLQENRIENQVIFLSEQPYAQGSPRFISGKDFPAIYRNATAFIYPSLYEGFGIPILEAMVSGTPVIASNSTSLPEVGGDAALYFEPGNADQLADLMLVLLSDINMRHERIKAGVLQSHKFTRKNCAQNLIQIYQQLL